MGVVGVALAEEGGAVGVGGGVLGVALEGAQAARDGVEVGGVVAVAGVDFGAEGCGDGGFGEVHLLELLWNGVVSRGDADAPD